MLRLTLLGMRIYVRQCQAGGFFCALLGPAATDAGAGSPNGDEVLWKQLNDVLCQGW